MKISEDLKNHKSSFTSIPKHELMKNNFWMPENQKINRRKVLKKIKIINNLQQILKNLLSLLLIL